ncbi:alpha-1,3-mannosyltransferase CMT1 [Xylariaceae sp. FL0804]|nr:alpha-1,3-mannosyltransferase CMT1 [Xylariaceae sp. FL0804]
MRFSGVPTLWDGAISTRSIGQRQQHGRAAIQLASLLLAITVLWVGYRSFASEPLPTWRNTALSPTGETGPSSSSTISTSDQVGEQKPEQPDSQQLDSKPSFDTAPYLRSILNPEDKTLPRLECPALDQQRYDYLRATGRDGPPPEALQYFFAIDLRQAVAVLPRLLGSVVEAIRFLGPAACALSIIEGHSDDGTREVLAALQPELAALGVAYFVRGSDVDPSTGQRIERLAELRNLALAPLANASAIPAAALTRRSRPAPRAGADTSVVFLNDVAACADDILELVHQRARQGADMTCAMDWTYVGRDPTFYDVWVSRTLAGDLFFDIPLDGNWNSAWNLFWNDEATRGRYAAGRPFQVYACWNGAVVFGAAPLLGRDAGGEMDEPVGFRASREGECYGGEPTLFCKDLWWSGYGRIAVVPSVNLEYSDDAAAKIKLLKGYTSRFVENEDQEKMPIDWVDEPPEKIRCMPVFEDQSWRPWNETLT